MIFQETKLKGAFIVELEKHEDERGFFARAFCAEEFERYGLCTQMVQANLSYSHKVGTLRGMHYQVSPASEPKFIRCVRGAVWDVIVDLRVDSPTYLEHVEVELSADNRRAIYVPDCFAHGNQALVDGSELFYMMGQYYTPGCARGLRYDDPRLGIQWPLPVSVMNEADRNWPLLPTNS
jgi:dTDP-4-dehydrorhamnose 3,5-epimerase